MDPGSLADAVTANTTDLSLGHTTSGVIKLPGQVFFTGGKLQKNQQWTYLKIHV